MNMVLFSIIVPVFNSDSFLNDCIKSVLNQSFKDWELLLIDDGSDDKSGFICDCYAKSDKRIKSFHKKNSGPFYTRLYGVTKSKGEYCLFLDSDDYFYKDALSFLLPYCKKKFDLIQFSYRKHNSKDNNNYCYVAEEKTIPDYRLLALQNKLSSMPCKCIKTSVVKGININNSFIKGKYGEDLIQTLLVADKVTRVLITTKQLFYYRENTSSTTHSISFFNFQNYFDVSVLETQKYYCKKWLGCYDLFYTKIASYWLNICYSLLVRSFEDEFLHRRKVSPKEYFSVRIFGIFSDDLSKQINNSDLGKKQKLLLKAYFYKKPLLFLLTKISFYLEFLKRNI